VIETYVIHITKECNCNCLYCYEQDKISKYTWEETKILLYNIIANTKEKFNVEFLGGEPMLNFSLIKKCIKFIEERTDQVCSYYITTNGTILNQEILDFLRQHEKIIFSISIDGTKFMNSLRVFKNGYNTHNAVIIHIQELKEIIGPRLFCHMTIHPYNVGWLYHGVRYLYNLGVNTITIGIIESTMQIGYEFCNRFIREMELVSKFVKERQDLFIDILETDESISNDKRHYIYDSDGKIIAETYGRAKDDIISRDVYSVKDVSGSDTNLIKELKIICSMKHKKE
jgi:uncharacterized protein